MEDKAFEPLNYLAKVFRLDTFEEFCVKRVHQQKGTAGLTPEELAEAFHFAGDYQPYFWPGSRLMQYFFVCTEHEHGISLALDERMSVFLDGAVDEYAPYESLWERVDPSGQEEQLIGDGPASVMEQFLKETAPERPVYFHLYGREGSGRRSRILQFCRRLNRSLLILDGRILREENQELLGKALRECRIYEAFLLIRDLPGDWFEPSLYREKLFRWMAWEAGILFTVSETVVNPGRYGNGIEFLQLELPLPDFSQSLCLWEQMLKDYQSEALDPGEWAGKFVFTPGQIRQAVADADRFARSQGRRSLTRTDMQRGCYQLLEGGMGHRAVKIKACYTWEELILPAGQKRRLKDACNQAACQKQVYETWGFERKLSYGKGLSVVFAGPPGTGKTMAAQVMAAELCLDLYRIELAAVVSKYIGETEKNLAEIFEQAQKSQVILFFDEADVLFSKRTQVHDSNDKYSNMEAAFMLQKMEEYEGITVLATNFLQNFDEAFKRRMKFIIDFPFPDTEQRSRIWQQVFPDEVPIKGDMDYEFLAGAFELSGSNIKNAALHGAFLAAAAKEPVSMAHVVAGIRNEYAKNGKILSKEQLGQYYMLLTEE